MEVIRGDAEVVRVTTGETLPAAEGEGEGDTLRDTLALAVTLGEALGAEEALLQRERRDVEETVGDRLTLPLVRPDALPNAVPVGSSCVPLTVELATPVELGQPLLLRDIRLLGEEEGLPLRVTAATVREAEVVVLCDTLGVKEEDRLRRALTLVEGV